MRERSIPIVATLALLLLSSAPARADENATVAAADQLFSEARDLMKQGDYAKACPKLATSHSLAPAIGTLLNLGVCYSKNGQTASAVLRLREAAALAAMKQDPREKYARSLLADIEPELARLKVEVPEAARPSGLRVELDGIELPEATWGIAIPIDPGPHVVRASCAGYTAWSVEMRGEARAVRTVAIPVLARDASSNNAPAAETPGPAEPEQSSSVQRTVGIAGVGVGGAAIVLGSVLGVLAKVKYDDAQSNCTGNVCQPEGREGRSSAEDLGRVSTIAFIAGGALAAGGLALWLTAPRASGPRAGIAPRSAGLDLRVIW